MPGFNHRAEVLTAPKPEDVQQPFGCFQALSGRLREIDRCSGNGSRRAPVQHGIATAQAACGAGASDQLVTAALLHRLGDAVMPAAARGAATATEMARLSADLLTDLYPPQVTEPIRLHASARRYLFSSGHRDLRRLDMADWRHLDPCLVPMTEPERSCFLATPFAASAIRLCRWSLAAAGSAAAAQAEAALHRIAERCVCNGGYGWGMPAWNDDEIHVFQIGRAAATQECHQTATNRR